MAVHGDIGARLDVLAVELPQKVDRPESARHIPTMLPSVPQRVPKSPEQKLAEDEIVIFRLALEDGWAVELYEGLQEKWVSWAAPYDALKDVIARKYIGRMENRMETTI